MKKLNSIFRFEASFLLLYLLLSVICLSGIVIGIIGFPIFFRTLSIDMLVFFMAAFVFFNRRIAIMSKSDKNVFIIFLAYSLLLLVHILIFMDDVKSQIITFRMFVLYPLVFSISIRSLFLNNDLKRITYIFNYFFSAVSAFSIVQFLFSSVLPNRLLTINDERAFGFYGFEMVRPTGLIGNTIIFSGFLLFAIAISYSSCLRYKTRTCYLSFALIMMANILTYSRASFVGSLLIIGILYFIYNRISFFKMLFIFISSACIILTLFLKFNDSLFMERLLDQNESSQGSTQTHVEEINHSLDVISSNPFFGIGFGTQGPSYTGSKDKIITDGFWFQVFIEQGGILGGMFVFIYILSLFYCIKIARKKINWQDNPFTPAFIAISLVYIFVCFLNSAIYNQLNYLLFWMVFFFATLKSKCY